MGCGFLTVDTGSMWLLRGYVMLSGMLTCTSHNFKCPPPLWFFFFFFPCPLSGQSWPWWQYPYPYPIMLICQKKIFEVRKMCQSLPPRWATFSGLAQKFWARAAVARHFAPPKQTPRRRPWPRIPHTCHEITISYSISWKLLCVVLTGLLEGVTVA